MQQPEISIHPLVGRLRYKIYIQTTVTVDFAALQAINLDIVVLLRIPGVLKYPVVRGKDVVFRLPERTGLLGS